MLGRGPPGAPPTLLNFDARNRAIRPISMRGSTSSDRLRGGGWGQWMGQIGWMGYTIDCAQALEDRAVPPKRVDPVLF